MLCEKRDDGRIYTKSHHGCRDRSSKLQCLLLHLCVYFSRTILTDDHKCSNSVVWFDPGVLIKSASCFWGFEERRRQTGSTLSLWLEYTLSLPLLLEGKKAEQLCLLHTKIKNVSLYAFYFHQRVSIIIIMIIDWIYMYFCMRTAKSSNKAA